MSDEDDRRNESLAGELKKKWDDADLALSMERRDYWLNYSFFNGQQWVNWLDESRDLVEWRPPSHSERDRVRLTINRVQPNIVNVLAKLTKRNLGFEVLASQTSDDVIYGARLGETVLEAMRLDENWEETRYEELFNCFLGGSAAVAVEWDGSAGDVLDIDDDSGAVIGTGQVRLTPLSIAEFTLEPGTRRASDARWWMMARALPAEQVQELYGMKEKPSNDSAAVKSPLQKRLLERQGYGSNTDMTVVYTYYERPGKKSKGKVVIMVNDQIIRQSPWPFPFKRLNLRVFRQITLPMRWTGHTFMNDARPLQVAYNAARSNMAEHMKLAGSARLTVPDTSLEYYENLTDEPGEVIPFDGVTGAKPSYLEPPNIPRWLIAEADRLQQELDDIMVTHAISRGEAPGDRNSGLALSVLAEKDETPLGLMAHDQAQGWGEIGSMVLELLASKVSETRQARIETESGVPIVMDWNGKMLRDQTRATVPLDKTLPHSRVALQAWLTSMAGSFPAFAQMMNGPTLSRLVDLPGTGALTELLDADVGKAQRENQLMAAERPVLPEMFDNHGIHIAEHNRDRKSPSYEFGTPESRSIRDDHILMHQKMEEEQALQQRDQNMIVDGSAALPQADEPPGSAVPEDFADQKALPAPGGSTPTPAPAG